MASPRIDERREFVKNRLNEGPISTKERKEIALRFECSPASVYSDIIDFTVDFGGVTRFLTSHIRQRVKKRDKETCQYCGVVKPKVAIIEHVIPYALGGVGREYNLVYACQSCNMKKITSVWVPRNLDEITIDRHDWREKVMSLASQ